MTKRYIDVLRDWNFWDQKIDTGKQRSSYLCRLFQWLDLPEIVALYGVRRSGKSTILLQFIEALHKKKGIPYSRCLYINFEDPRLGANLSGQDLFAIFEEYQHAFPTKARVFLFLDEVQQVFGWEKFVLSLYEQKKNIKIFVTGSSSQLLNAELSTLLSGRVLPLSIMPLSFREFLVFKKKLSARREEKYHLFDEYLEYGGFPRVVLEKNKVNKRDLLVSYYNTILERDIISKNQIKKKAELKELTRYLMSNIGSIVSTYNLQKILDISNVQIRKYLEMLADAFLVSESKYFAYSVKKQIYNPSKIYSVDTGLANVAGFNFSQNKGKLLENVVNNHLRSQGKEIYYWKNSTEIDFVVFAERKLEEIINVTLTVDHPSVREREFRSLSIAQKELKAQKVRLLTLYNQSQLKDSRISELLPYLGKGYNRQ